MRPASGFPQHSRSSFSETGNETEPYESRTKLESIPLAFSLANDTVVRFALLFSDPQPRVRPADAAEATHKPRLRETLCVHRNLKASPLSLSLSLSLDANDGEQFPRLAHFVCQSRTGLCVGCVLLCPSSSSIVSRAPRVVIAAGVVVVVVVVRLARARVTVFESERSLARYTVSSVACQALREAEKRAAAAARAASARRRAARETARAKKREERAIDETFRLWRRDKLRDDDDADDDENSVFGDRPRADDDDDEPRSQSSSSPSDDDDAGSEAAETPLSLARATRPRTAGGRMAPERTERATRRLSL